MMNVVSIFIHILVPLLLLVNVCISSTLEVNVEEIVRKTFAERPLDFNETSSKNIKLFPVVVNTWPIPQATHKAWEAITSGSSAVESVVAGCSVCEDGSCGSSIGAGGSPDENGETTLDAMIMDGRTMDVGSVGCLREVQSAISVAHDVMKYTKHTLLVGELASDFAVSMGYERKSLQTKSSHKSWQNWIQKKCQPNFRQNVSPDPTRNCGPYIPNGQAYAKYLEKILYSGKSPRYNEFVDEDHHDTIGMVAIDAKGNIASGTTTNGATHKVPGRVGDSPIMGAGSYAENGKGAAAATGDGDVMMRLLPSFHTVQLMGEGHNPTVACQMSIERISKFYPKNYAGIVAINQEGKHGGACHNFKPFQYNAINSTTGVLETIIVECSTSQ